ncbi:MAG: methionine synthase [Proteobacteria bacterium]|nr:methionine synthase [Pseudomonadota bacterium]
MDSEARLMIEFIVQMEEQKSVEQAKKMLESGYQPLELLSHCRAAMETVGQKYETGEFFLAELMMAGEILSQISDIAKPLIQKNQKHFDDDAPLILIGTVEGDLHDIGKNIVSFMLEINGFKVIDLGIDVPVQTFVDQIRENKPVIVGLSGFLTVAFDAMKETVTAIESSGLRKGVKIMVGGGQVDEIIQNHTGADAFGTNAMDAVRQCKAWVQ